MLFDSKLDRYIPSNAQAHVKLPLMLFIHFSKNYIRWHQTQEEVYVIMAAWTRMRCCVATSNDTVSTIDKKNYNRLLAVNDIILSLTSYLTVHYYEIISKVYHRRQN